MGIFIVLQGQILIEFIQQHDTNNYLACIHRRHHHNWFWQQSSPQEMVMQLNQIRACLSSIHTNKKLQNIVIII